MLRSARLLHGHATSAEAKVKSEHEVPPCTALASIMNRSLTYVSIPGSLVYEEYCVASVSNMPRRPAVDRIAHEHNRLNAAVA